MTLTCTAPVGDDDASAWVLVAIENGLDFAILGPFATPCAAQEHARAFRATHGIPGHDNVDPTEAENEAWTDAGWYFGIHPIAEPASGDSCEVLPFTLSIQPIYPSSAGPNGHAIAAVDAPLTSTGVLRFGTAVVAAAQRVLGGGYDDPENGRPDALELTLVGPFDEANTSE